MGELFGRFKVRTKMFLLMAVAVICLLATQALMLNEIWHDMNTERQDGLINLTDVASSLIKRQEALVNSNSKTIEEAQAEALADLRSLRYGNNEYFFVLDTQFNMLMHPISDKLDGSNVKNVTDPNGKLLMQELARVATTQGQGFVDYEWNRAGSTELIPKLSLASYHSQWSWIVVTGVYTDDILDTFMGELWLSLEASTITLILFAIIATAITRSIVTPVNELERVIAKVSDSQDLTLRAHVTNHDEFGQMANAFNGMLDSFQQLILEITSATSQVSSSAIELSATTEQTKQGMEQQQNETILVATAMNQMNATVHEVTQNTQEAANASRDAADESRKGQEVVNSAIAAVQSLSTRLTESSKITQTLKEESDNISNILSVINGIAEQTNLLALNAAIEAARAGEQGRGFAVVADEVRSLSARTAESTKEIAAVIERLQSGTEAAANAMLTSSDEANNVVEQTLKAGDSLTKISTAIERIDAMTIQISSASEQQSCVADEINQNIDNINNVSKEGAVGANQIAQASEELAKLAEHLKETSEKFIISSA